MTRQWPDCISQNTKPTALLRRGFHLARVFRPHFLDDELDQEESETIFLPWQFLTNEKAQNLVRLRARVAISPPLTVFV
jgi:hypothetical protein